MKQAQKNKRWTKRLNKFKNDFLQCIAEHQRINMYILGKNEPMKKLKEVLNHGIDHNDVAQERAVLNYILSAQKTNY